ncbi:hypothetical protein M9H77_23236 [Catharanthus roseus]|uniref:Uncharacterized protein n=1 Tax=Catharanthus roseus TaxID=4058 RepID=A0ACC0ASF4_CATRO|nr:hypothetical protein M9H77_23236 [Catharanthus roseus]
MAKDGIQKILETVNARLKNKQVKIVSVDTVGNAKSGSTSTIVPSNIGSTNEIRGIKTKENLTRRSSKRLQSSLEKATKKRKTKGKRSSQSTQYLHQQENRLPILKQAKTGCLKLCSSSCYGKQEEAPTPQSTLQYPHPNLPRVGEGAAAPARGKSSRNSQ